MRNFPLRAGLWQVVVNCLFVNEVVSQSYTRNYDGYVFTSPGLSAYKKRDEAQALCAQNGSKLLEIKSDNVQALTVQFLSDTGIQFTDPLLLFFTNGMRKDDSWNWVNGQDINSITVYGQGQDLTNSFGYINFITNPPGLYIAAGVSIDVRGYICQVAGEADCTNGFSKNGICFQSYSSPTMSWFDARNRCLNDGGDLASFDFINDDQELNSTLYGSWLSSSTTYWTGMRRQLWRWQNFEARYTHWMNGRPVYRLENQCLCLSKSGTDWKWIECSCYNAFPFVCLTEPTATPSLTSSTTQVTTRISITGTSASTIFRTVVSLFTMEPPVSTDMASCSADNRALAVGLGIGIPSVLIILALIIVIVMLKKRLSYQTRLLANRTVDADTMTDAQSPVKRNPQTRVNGGVEMVSDQNTSPYESLKHGETTINDGNYQELRIPSGRGTNNPQTLDYEPVRIG